MRGSQPVRKNGCQIVDIRSPTSFGAGHIPGSISIWREGLPAVYGMVPQLRNTDYVIVDDFNLDLDTVHAILSGSVMIILQGILSGGFPAWTKAAQELPVPTCSVQQLRELLEQEIPFILDVRDMKNWRSVGHITAAHHRYIGELPGIDEIPKDEPSSSIAMQATRGVLQQASFALTTFHNLTNVSGGYDRMETGRI